MDANFNSVSLLPFDRMAAMTCERFFFEKTSAIACQPHATGIISRSGVFANVLLENWSWEPVCAAEFADDFRHILPTRSLKLRHDVFPAGIGFR
jgi:hypothetical protein